MEHLPVIVGFGGYNAAGRSSFHHGFRRMIIESLDAQDRAETLAGLAVMCKIVAVKDGDYVCQDGQPLTLQDIEARYKQQILDATLVRRIEKNYFDVDNVSWQQSVTPNNAEATTFTLANRQLPQPIPASWSLEKLDEKNTRVTLSDNTGIYVSSLRDYAVKAAGQLPSNFDPSEHYNARFHPKGLQMTVMGVSDALHSTGIEWQKIKNAVRPDQISVYASSAMGQCDENGNGGMMMSRQKGGRVTAKQLALGLNTMPGDFINAYVLGNVGTTGATTGACASFLYNLKNGVEAIQKNQARVVIVGCSEAPLTPEIIDGYTTMGALGTAAGLREVEGVGPEQEPDYRKSSRPFGDNCGFTLSESAQFFVLMDDALAVELGAQIQGAVSDVFINADGFKKSIPSPGPGNYLTLAKAVAAARDLVGMEALKNNSFIMAHGSSTPQNRTTESELLSRVAATFEIEHWPVVAVKAYIGHPLAPASGDQLAVAMGAFEYNVLPGIKTIGAVADDVIQDNLDFFTDDKDVAQRPMQVAFLNSKGFGGNNASAVVLSPSVTLAMIEKRHGSEDMQAWQCKHRVTVETAQQYEQDALHGNYQVIYNFGSGMIDDKEMVISQSGISIPGFDHDLLYQASSRYNDML